MKQIVQGLNWFDKSAHGYWKAKSHFKGDLVREVFVTAFDKEKQETAQGYLFLTRENALLSLLSNAGGLAAGVHEFTSDDSFSVSETGDLTEILNKTVSTEKNLSVGTSHKVAFVTINSRYQLLHSIQVAHTYGKSQLNLKTTYLVGDNYVDQAKALAHALSNVVKQKPISEVGLPGLKASVALTTIYVGTLVSLGVVAVLLYFLYLFLTGNLNFR